jgi:phosphoenolpyruvate carboxykinase (ATP)
MVKAALSGALDIVKYRHDEIFNLDVPTECPDVPAEVLIPKNTWIDKDSYTLSAKNLLKCSLIILRDLMILTKYVKLAQKHELCAKNSDL